MIRAAAIVCLAVLPAVAAALPLDIPSPSVMTAERHEAKGDAPMPLAPWPETAPRAEGPVLHRAWRIGSPSLTTLQILAPLRDQLAALGYEVLFECADADCGGFDFRYGLDLIGEPDMHVDLGDFRYLAAQRGENDRATLVVSRSASAGFVHLTWVGEPEVAVPAPPREPAVAAPATGDLASVLDRTGRAVLTDLVFGTGAADLGAGPFASLDALAAYMARHPDRSVVLVGHTDAQGALDANIALSRRRAGAVMARLIEAHGIDPDRLRAEGVGYLVPMASNATASGREANRRVEAIVTHTE